MNLADSSTFSVSTTPPVNQQISAAFPLNIDFFRALMPQFDNGFSLEVDGTIQQGGVAQSVNFSLFFGISPSAGQNSGITLTIPAGSFTINTTAAYKVVVNVVSQGNANPNAATPCHFSITIFLAGVPIASSSFGTNLSFQQQVDTVGVPYKNQFVWLDTSIGAAGPIVQSFTSKYTTYGFGS